MATNPTHEQAELQLKIFDLRREPLLRKARDWFAKNYVATTLDEAMRIAPMGSEAGTYYMMVVSYWDHACAYLNHGLLHEDLFYKETLPKLLGRDFKPRGNFQSAAIGKPGPGCTLPPAR